MVADFSSLNEPGWYYFQSGETKSPPFEIKPSVYQDLHQALVHALFLQRSGQAVYSAQTGMARPPSHMEDGSSFVAMSLTKRGQNSTVRAVGMMQETLGNTSQRRLSRSLGC